MIRDLQKFGLVTFWGYKQKKNKNNDTNHKMYYKIKTIKRLRF